VASLVKAMTSAVLAPFDSFFTETSLPSNVSFDDVERASSTSSWEFTLTSFFYLSLRVGSSATFSLVGFDSA
jgi:hypothetical protein